MEVSKEDRAFFLGVGLAVVSTLTLYLLLGYGLELSTIIGVIIGLVAGFIASR